MSCGRATIGHSSTRRKIRSRSDPNKGWRHVVAASASELVFEERDELFDVAASRSLDRKIIFFGSFAKTTSEQRLLASDNPAGEFRVILSRQAGHEYDTDHYEGRLYIRTNKGAKNFRVVSAPLEDPSEARWASFIDANHAVKIESMTFFARYGVVNERGRRSVVPPSDRHENAGVAPHHDRGVGLRPLARRESRVLHRHGALRVPIDGDALVRVRLPDGYARADSAQTAGGPRRV